MHHPATSAGAIVRGACADGGGQLHFKDAAVGGSLSPKLCLVTQDKSGGAKELCSITAGYRLRVSSTASAAESFRSRCGSVRGAPVCSSQTSPIAAPHVLQGTDNICFGVSSLVFTPQNASPTNRKDVQY